MDEKTRKEAEQQLGQYLGLLNWNNPDRWYHGENNMSEQDDEWCFTLAAVIYHQHRAIEVAAKICELENQADHKQLAELIRGVKQPSGVPKTAPPEQDRNDPKTWRFCESDLIGYQSDAFEKAAQICEIETEATNVQLAEMIRSLKQENRLI